MTQNPNIELQEKTEDAPQSSVRSRKLSHRAARHTIRVAKVGGRQTVKVARLAHHHVAKRPHQYLTGKWAWYARWHNWRWHGLVHGVLTGAYVFAAGLMVFTALMGPASASGNWLQDDWSGGVGANTSTQYSAISNLDGTADQLSLSKGTNKFSNTNFDSNRTGWFGGNVTHDTSQSYSASGSAKIVAGASSSNVFNTQATHGTVTSTSYRNSAGDVNNDGLQELAVVNPAANTVSLYPGVGTGTLGTATTLSTLATPYDVKIANVNGDGWKDIVVSYFNNQGKISVFFNNGSGGFTTSTDTAGLTAFTRECGIEIADLNNDNDLDIVAMCQGFSFGYIFTNNGSGTLTATTTATFAASNNNLFALIDVNGDTLPELVGATDTVCTLYIYPNTGGGFGTANTHTITACGGSGVRQGSLEAGDFNSDGYGDVVIGRRSGSTAVGGDAAYASTFFGTSSNTISTQTNYAMGAVLAIGAYGGIAVADFSLDNKLDFATTVQSASSSVVLYYQNNGDGTFATAVSSSSGASMSGISAIDLNADGKPDLAANSNTAGNLGLFTNRLQGDAITQLVNAGNTNQHTLEAYVYTNGSAVTSADAVLWSNGQALSTTIAASSVSGWYRLFATIAGTNDLKSYGVLAKQGKTIYVDNLNIYEYQASGSLTSAIFDPSYGGAWGVLSWSTTESASVTVKVRTSPNSDMSGATSFASCNAATSGQDITGNNCVTDGDRYVQYQVSLARVNGGTPVFSSVDLAYAAYDIVPPDTNASDIEMSKTNGGANVGLNDWTNGGSPYFSWTAGEDNAGGVGLAGYCAYLGTDGSADPATTKGSLGTSQVPSNSACPFIVSGTSLNLATAGLLETALASSNSAYHLRLKAVDTIGNVHSGGAEDFYFRFDNTVPTNPGYLSAPSQFINTKIATITWPSSGGGVAEDGNSGVAGLQYRINNTSWYGDDHTGAGDMGDLLDNDGNYTTVDPPDFDNIDDGINTVYFRTWDNAGNVSTSYVTVPLKVNTNGSPSEPQNLQATPSTNTSNSFAFNWAAPATFVGNANTLQYCYTVNVLPSSGNCNYTSAGETSIAAGPFATQPGVNTLYLVARDESNNINYSSYASTTFTANTPAPGIPQTIDVADVSVKTTNNWRLAVTWDEPASVGVGVSAYRIFRSTDNSSFSQVGSSASTSYVDTGLSQVEYFYKVRACDSANNCGAYTSTVSMTPTGKFTEPASMTSEPVVSGVTTKRATINWSTDRASDSKIAIGVTSGDYSPSEVGNSSQVTSHKLDLDNLAAGTTYYFQARWTDADGNTGTSQEYTFTTAPAPLLKEVNTLTVTLSAVTLQFTIKDSTKVEVQYGKSDSFGGVKSINTSLSESTYELELTGLDDGTKYLYRLIMQDTEGGKYQSSIFSFTTPPRPAISNLRFQPLEGEPTSTQQVTWTTNIPTNSMVSYGKVGTNGTVVQSQEFKTTHEVIIRGLEDNSEYFLIAQGRDANGNLAVSDRQVFKTALDTRPPTIFDIVIEPTIRGTGAEARGQIVVSWKTDEPATSQVAYAEGSVVSSFNNRTAEDATLTTEHLVIVSDLPPSRVYSIMPVSRDKSSNASTSKSQAAIIGRASDSVLNIVLNTLRKVFGL